MKLIKIFIVMFCFVSSMPVFAAADAAPVAMLKSTSSQMLRELDKHIGQLKNNKKLINDLVNRVFVPHFDLVNMSRAVVGVNWQKANSNIQQQFIKEFTRYIIRTYSSALEAYDGETIKFYPIRGTVGGKAQVDSDLLVKSGPPIQIQYRLLQQGGQWLIYDFSVNGVSIVKNYNSQFAGILRQKGLGALVNQLHKNNASQK